jgi:hypothetical protein
MHAGGPGVAYQWLRSGPASASNWPIPLAIFVLGKVHSSLTAAHIEEIQNGASRERLEAKAPSGMCPAFQKKPSSARNCHRRSRPRRAPRPVSNSALTALPTRHLSRESSWRPTRLERGLVAFREQCMPATNHGRLAPTGSTLLADPPRGCRVRVASVGQFSDVSGSVEGQVSTDGASGSQVA